MQKTKVCSKCLERKSLDQFYGRRSACRSCYLAGDRRRRNHIPAATVSNVPEALIVEGAPNVYKKPGETFSRPAWHLKIYGGNKTEDLI